MQWTTPTGKQAASGGQDLSGMAPCGYCQAPNPKEGRMRYIILTAAFVVLAPVTYAQTSTGNTGGMNNPNRTNMPSNAATTGQRGPENCGTPDEPKSCPPMPRHPLPYYPANKQ